MQTASVVAKWSGVVSVERPNQTQHIPFSDPACRVLSARNIQLNGMRAIATQLPWSAVKHYFKSDDGAQVFVAADLVDEHLQLRERCNDVREWGRYSCPVN